MKTLTLLFSTIFILFCVSNLMAADQPVAFPTEIIQVNAQNCPVMGGEINKEVFTINNGHLYYFCCPGCIGMFNAEPEKYLEKLKDAPTKALKVTNVDGKCPVSGLAADLKFFKIDEEAATITFYHNEESMNK